MKSLDIPLFNLPLPITESSKVFTILKNMNKTGKDIKNKWVKEFKKFPAPGTIALFKLLVVTSSYLDTNETRIVA